MDTVCYPRGMVMKHAKHLYGRSDNGKIECL